MIIETFFVDKRGRGRTVGMRRGITDELVQIQSRTESYGRLYLGPECIKDLRCGVGKGLGGTTRNGDPEMFR